MERKGRGYFYRIKIKVEMVAGYKLQVFREMQFPVPGIR
jgi:hypothetical protein